jgi:hypothetical protein
MNFVPVKYSGGTISVGSTYTVSGGGSPLTGWCADFTHNGGERLRDIAHVSFAQPNQGGTNENQIVVTAAARETSNMNQIQAASFVLDYDVANNSLTQLNSDYPFVYTLSHGDVFTTNPTVIKLPTDGTRCIALALGQEGEDRVGPKTFEYGLRVLKN